MRYYKYVLTVLLTISILVLNGCTNANGVKNSKTWLCQFQNFSPSLISKTHFDVVVIDYSYDGSDAEALKQEEIEKMKSTGKTVLAYMNVGYAEEWRFYWDKIKDATFVGNNDTRWPGEHLILDFDTPKWESVIQQYVNKIKKEGFDGIYLDGVNAYESFQDEKKYADEMIALLKYVRKWLGNEGKISILNAYGLYKFDPSIANLVNYLSVESLFYLRTRKRKEPYYSNILNEVKLFLEKGVKVLSVDYVDDGSGYKGENVERIRDYVKLARENGLIPYAARSNMKLNNLNVIPGIQGE
ncbi:MJ1477/TM1410 family putative glycoside hydrolase [Mesoaciditoga lauensis]|uniref:MJ1477/TM1410 family putative glycoside hydrolase n=1 Tax=Mesoaciditoga lauensis TaxID=1495039 RepID=UPI0005659C77|nr:MJ1477/TM1410 family putative glycoside hydrolase [Mesoaciditoga lauensis]